MRKKLHRLVMAGGARWRRLAMSAYRRSRRKLLVSSAFPKSASRQLVNLLELAGRGRMKSVSGKASEGSGQIVLSAETVARSLNFRKDTLLYGHIPFSQHNLAVILELTDAPRFLVPIRPLPDVVVSYREHVERDPDFFGPLDARAEGLPEGCLAWDELDVTERHEFLIRFVMPWFVRFLAGWVRGAERWPVAFLTFEEHTVHPAACVESVGRFLGVEFDPRAIESLADPENVPRRTLNRGTSDRGFEQISSKQIRYLEDLVALQGRAFRESHLAAYLLRGFAGLPIGPADLIAARARGYAWCGPEIEGAVIAGRGGRTDRAGGGSRIRA